MKHGIGNSKNGIAVSVDLIHSAAAASIASQPHLLTLAEEAVKHITLRGTRAKVTYNMKRTIGYDFVVETTDKSMVLYAQIVHETIYTRFVKNGEPTATSYITLELHLGEDGNYELSDIWLGCVVPPRPGSPNETPESRPFWETHAFVLDAQRLQPRTITKDCPY